MRIAMWSGPRNLSTAMMYAFAARGDCAVWDEPFYAAFLHSSGLDHPMRDATIADGLTDPDLVSEACATGPVPGALPLFYQKHMAHHMLPGFDIGFMRACTNVFLIRHPARVVASYVRKREAPDLADLGFARQAALFDAEADRTGQAPIVVDSADIRADPAGMMRRLCDALAIPFTGRMLHWPAGPKPFDGAWAPHWYGAVHRSTGFDGAEGPLPALSGSYARFAEASMPHYTQLYAHRITPA